jgi:hypothetical protein
VPCGGGAARASQRPSVSRRYPAVAIRVSRVREPDSLRVGRPSARSRSRRRPSRSRVPPSRSRVPPSRRASGGRMPTRHRPIGVAPATRRRGAGAARRGAGADPRSAGAARMSPAASYTADRVPRPAIVSGALAGLLRRSGLAEVLDPVVVGVTAAVRLWPELIPPTARLTAESAALLMVGLRIAALLAVGHRSDWQRPTRVIGAKHRIVSEPWIGFGGNTPTDRTGWPGVVVVGVGPPQTLLVLRPSRCHNDCYSRD